MRMYFASVLLGSAFASGCALPSLDYHPYTHVLGGGGYKDKHLGGDQWAVSYMIAGAHDMATVTSFALRRAKEVCQDNAYKDYRLNGGLQHLEGEVFATVTCVK